MRDEQLQGAAEGATIQIFSREDPCGGHCTTRAGDPRPKNVLGDHCPRTALKRQPARSDEVDFDRVM